MQGEAGSPAPMTVLCRNIIAMIVLKAAADAQPAAAPVASVRAHEHLTPDRVGHPPSGTSPGDLFVGVVLGGAIGILVFGMIGHALFGRALDTVGFVAGSLVGVTLVRASGRRQLR
jgi:hypothetical protein